MPRHSESKSYPVDDLSQLYARAAGLDEVGRRALLDPHLRWLRMVCAPRSRRRRRSGHRPRAGRSRGLADAAAPEAMLLRTVVGAWKSPPAAG